MEENSDTMESWSSWDSPVSPDFMSAETKEKGAGAFYEDAAQYWSQVPATVDGMLGGYGFISKVDIQGSNQFLKQLFRLKEAPGNDRALDCGAGIGRITQGLLLNHFQKVDLVEQDPAFVDQARASLESHKNMGNFYCTGLQDFTPEPAKYDVIWCQWVLSHLKDDDLIAFLQGCILGLKENGVIILKENTTTSGKLDVDTTDSSVTRPLDVLCALVQRAGLKCVKQKRQENFPKGLYPVYMIATRPIKERTANDGNPGCASVPMEIPGNITVDLPNSKGSTELQNVTAEALEPSTCGAITSQDKIGLVNISLDVTNDAAQVGSSTQTHPMDISTSSSAFCNKVAES